MAIDGKGRPTKEQAAAKKRLDGYLQAIAAYEREFKKWETRSDKILKKYRDERNTTKDSQARFNILFSNVQTLVPAVFAKVPKPDVSRRFRDNDPVGRVAALILERALEYETEHYPDYYATIRQDVYDRFLGGRGTAWVRYEPHMQAQSGPEDGVQVSDAVDEPGERLDYECAPIDYVHWKEFGHSVARTWEEVYLVWRWVYMRMPAKIERFGEQVAKTIPLDAPPKENKAAQSEQPQDGSWVCELWDKNLKRAVWFAKAATAFLDEKDDPLGLEEFFPCPRPLYATLTNESLIPVPDFTMYQDQARALDTLADRIEGLINMMQVKGVYDDSVPALARIFTEGENGNLLPAKNWAQFAEKNGLAGTIDVLDLKPIYEALQAAYAAFQQQLQQVYDITGLSDIVRGQGDPTATATQERIKGQYASLRLKALQGDVARFSSEVMQLKAQVICGQFSVQTISQMAGVDQLADADKPHVPAAMALLIGKERLMNPDADSPNPLRNFRIEVNSDTMVQMDEDAEKEAAVEFIAAQGAFMEKALPMAQANSTVMPLIAALWKFSVRSFKVGKTLEGEFDAVIDAAKQAAAAPQQPKPDPEMEKVKAQAAADQAKAQADQQATQQKLTSETQLAQQKLTNEENLKRMELAMEERLAVQEQTWMQRFEMWKAELMAGVQVKTAQIKAENMPEPARKQ